LKHDPGFSDAIYGLSGAFFVIGYMILGVPGAIVFELWSARKWTACILIAFGLSR